MLIRPRLETVLDKAWRRTEAASSEALADSTVTVNLMFVGESRMKSVNKENRGINETTDVLSFPMHDLTNGVLNEEPQEWDFEVLENEDGEIEESLYNLGDILISLEAAAEQAKEYGHSEEREIVFLALHGLLHLLGYDHEDDEMEALMQAEADAILSEAGLDRTEGENVLSAALSGDAEEAQDDNEDAGEDKAEADRDGGPGYELVLPRELPEGFKSGFVAIVGRPNVGKSTLLNRLTGTHIAITSAKAQTTRYNIRSIVNRDDAQLVFIDTPGLHKSTHRLDEYMMKDSWSAVEDADVILLMIDSGRSQITQMEKNVIAAAERSNTPLVLAINKADDLPKPELLPIIARYHRLHPFRNIIPISATRGDGVEELLDLLQEELPEGPMLFDPDDYTDQSERQLAAEYIREQLLFYMHQEIPHGTAVLIETFEEIAADNPTDEYDRKLVRIEASILCDKDSHKGMIIGRNGQNLKRISSSARIRLEELLGCKVYLKCFVKVRPDWRNKSSILTSLGFAYGDKK